MESYAGAWLDPYYRSIFNICMIDIFINLLLLLLITADQTPMTPNLMVRIASDQLSVVLTVSVLHQELNGKEFDTI